METNAPENLEQPVLIADVRADAEQQMEVAFQEIMAEEKANAAKNNTAMFKSPKENPAPIKQEVEDDLELDNPEIEEPSDNEPVSSSNETVPLKSKVGRPSKKDFEEEYNKLKLDYEAQVGLWRSRADNVSKQYQELKDTLAKQATTESVEYPDQIKEVFETFPDIADAVTYLIESKVGKIQKDIEPLQQHAMHTAQQQLLATITAVHPDVVQIVDSGDLNVWAASLPVVQRHGAFAVLDHGSPEEIIELLNQYKSDKGRNNNGNSSEPKMGFVQKSASNSNIEGSTHSENRRGNSSTDSSYSTSGARGRGSDTDSIVEKVLAALNVPSSREPVDINPSTASKEKTWEDAIKEIESQQNRRRR